MKGFVLDLNRCTGCHACLLACSIENNRIAEKSWREVYTFNARSHPGVAKYHLSIGCLHCADPACMKNCPALAYSRDPSTGAVLVDERLCIGCKYCQWACPFDAPRYSRSAGTVSKCTFCNSRLIDGLTPACTALCPTGALQFAELQPEQEPQAVPGFPETGIGPAIRFVPPRSSSGPEIHPIFSASPQGLCLEAPDTAPAPKVRVESEWSLIVFTLATVLLVAIMAAAAMGSLHLHPNDFMTAALAAFGFGALHLGKKFRAWRAILNLRDSWLSREIAAYAVFLALASAMFFMPSAGDILRPAVTLSGFTVLFCIDFVYLSVSNRKSIFFHSAGATITGLFLSGIFAGNALLAAAAGLTKLVLYAERQSWSSGRGRFLASLMRLGFGFVAPLAAWSVYPGWIWPAALIGEVIDRVEYYLDLEIASPRSQTALELRETLSALAQPDGNRKLRAP